MRTSSLLLDARALIQPFGLACADQGHPRAALDKGDLRIAIDKVEGFVKAQLT
jgi:hypothetical protein